MSSASYEITSQRRVSTWLQSHKRSLLLNEAMLLIFIMISFLSVFISSIVKRGGTRFFQWCGWKHVPPGHQPRGKYWMKGVLDVSSGPLFLCVRTASSGPWNIFGPFCCVHLKLHPLNRMLLLLHKKWAFSLHFNSIDLYLSLVISWLVRVSFILFFMSSSSAWFSIEPPVRKAAKTFDWHNVCSHVLVRDL